MSFQILAISGSLRAGSSNTAVLEAAKGLLPTGASLTFYTGLAGLPPFNPELEAAGGPPAVKNFQQALAACQAVLISSPEYAHGVPGALKNALDWVVGSGELIGKPVGLITLASAYAPRNWALEQLSETMRVMSADLHSDAIVNLPGTKKDLQELGRMSSDAEGALRALLAALMIRR